MIDVLQEIFVENVLRCFLLNPAASYIVDVRHRYLRIRRINVKKDDSNSSTNE